MNPRPDQNLPPGDDEPQLRGEAGPEADVPAGDRTQPLVAGNPASTLDDHPDQHPGHSAEDAQRMAAARERYMAAAHAVQSGIAMLMQRNKNLGHPKHLQVGVDTMKVEQGGLAKLLIDKGLFTWPEYFEAMADAMEDEVRRSEAELSQLYHGAKITLA